jgi:hypothetical protein
VRPTAAFRTWFVGLALLCLSACSGGVQAGGDEPTNNGGIAFIGFAVFLILTSVILWLILGRGD